MKTYKCKCCKEQIENQDELLEIEKEYKSGKTKFRYHKLCYEQMRKDKEEWDKLYDYIRYDVLHMEEGKQLPKSLRNRLQSLRFGEYQIKGKKEKQVYTYEQMYYTFVICRMSIESGLQINKIKKDVDISNYMMAIISNNINDIVDRMKSREDANEQLGNITKNINTQKYEYIKKEQGNVGELLNNLW